MDADPGDGLTNTHQRYRPLYLCDVCLRFPRDQKQTGRRRRVGCREVMPPQDAISELSACGEASLRLTPSPAQILWSSLVSGLSATHKNGLNLLILSQLFFLPV
jgi:hypothetical protein